jgi:hypothetical protein
MKKVLVLLMAACLLLVAGCSTVSTDKVSGDKTTLAMPEPASLSSGNYSFNASISEISVDSSEPGKHTTDIYLTVKNTGSIPVRLSWFSTITGKDGTSYGGVNVSHGGSGAHSTLLFPGSSEMSRDYVVVDSDAGYAALSRGATLDVAFTGQESVNETPANFHAAWMIDPKYFP